MPVSKEEKAKGEHTSKRVILDVDFEFRDPEFDEDLDQYHSRLEKDLEQLVESIRSSIAMMRIGKVRGGIGGEGGSVGLHYEPE